MASQFAEVAQAAEPALKAVQAAIDSASVLLALDRHVRVVNGARSNLAFGATFTEARDRFWNAARLQEEWTKPGRRVLITGLAPERSVVRTLPPGTVHAVARAGGRWLYANVGD